MKLTEVALLTLFLFTRLSLSSTSPFLLKKRDKMSGLARAISSEASSDGYEPKVILITGAAGFIGSHTALRLVKNLPNVRVS